MEEELVEEGMPREELLGLYDVHIAVFREQLEKEAPLQIPPEHLLNILLEEHKILLRRAERLKTVLDIVEQACEKCDLVYIGDALKELQAIATDF
ncbi:MAG: uncharacterized protein QG670_2203 [Thermoproteota archaeon]|nr:uncharacterized protein [Thermoproteota archaeon]